MPQQTQQEFGKIRSIFWPVHSYETKKLLPLFFMFFFISFNYAILRDTKDSIIVPTSGAETIPFLKFWGTVPAAAIFMLIYIKLSNTLSKEKLFYVTLSPFIIFFILFATVLYPNRELLHPTTSADFLQSFLPAGWHGLVAVYRNWTYSVFYILAELWGSVVLSLMFWGFANDIMRVTEAKRFYTLLIMGANAALLISGPLITYFSNIRNTVPAGVDAWQISLNYLIGMFFIASVSIVALYWYMQRNVLSDPRYFDPTQVKKKKNKPKMSLMDSFAFLARSKYLLCLMVLVASYGLCINLVEVIWKGQLVLQYPNSNDYSAFMGKLSFFTGLVTVCLSPIARSIIRRYGWGFAAMVTPTVLMASGVAFFAFIIFRDFAANYIMLLGTTPLFMAVIFGMIQNIISKSTKYSLFDPTKEMSYIPLDDESKVKGKAAIDVVGARLGKSGGSVVYQILFAFGTLAAITPIVAVIMVAVVGAWMVAVRSLSKQFMALTTEAAPAPVPAAAEKPEPATV